MTNIEKRRDTNKGTSRYLNANSAAVLGMWYYDDTGFWLYIRYMSTRSEAASLTRLH